MTTGLEFSSRGGSRFMPWGLWTPVWLGRQNIKAGLVMLASCLCYNHDCDSIMGTTMSRCDTLGVSVVLVWHELLILRELYPGRFLVWGV